MDNWDEFLLNLQAYVLVACIAAPIGLICLLSARYMLRRPLPIPRLRPGRWTGRDVILSLCTYWVVAQVLFAVIFEVVRPWLPNDAPNAALELSIYLSPLMVGVPLALTFWILHGRARPNQVGLTLARWPANIVLGILAFLVISPIALTIDYLVTLGFPSEPHPFTKIIGPDFTPWGWALLIFATVIGAPLLEETLYRGVLQGWLRRASLAGHLCLMGAIFVIGARSLCCFDMAQLGQGPMREVAEQLAPKGRSEAAAPLVFGMLMIGCYGSWLWLLWYRYQRDQHELPASETAEAPNSADTSDAIEEDEDVTPVLSVALPLTDPVQDERQHAWAWAAARLSVFGSAMLFAMSHAHWPDPIPLLFFGVGIGWLAYRTQSLIGPMVCHALFNAVACVALYWGAAAK
jgi:membrane protease YdiL (CAAX protease family)